MNPTHEQIDEAKIVAESARLHFENPCNYLDALLILDAALKAKCDELERVIKAAEFCIGHNGKHNTMTRLAESIAAVKRGQ